MAKNRSELVADVVGKTNYVKEWLLDPGHSVEGLIIVREEDTGIRRALSVAQNIRFMKCRVEFHLE